MKKTLIFTSLVIMCLTSMSFRGCGSYEFFGALLSGAVDFESGRYDYFGDNSTVEHYSIYAGANGKIVRSKGTNNIIFETKVSGTTQQLNSVRVSNNPYQDEAAIAGNNGTVLVSGNSGLNWTLKTPVTSSNLYGIDHAYYLYAVGDNGTILYANEIITGSLVMRSSGTTRNLKGVSISNVNNQRVIAVGEKGTILRTTDGGFNWLNVSIPDTTFNFYAISHKGIYYTGDIFVAVGSGGRIYKSTDVGASWQQKTSGTVNTLRDVYFLSQDSGVAAGDNGTIRFTTNGGESWFSDAYFNSPSSRNYKSVSCSYRENKTFSSMSDTVFYVSQDPVLLGIEKVSSGIPNSFSLAQNYPNPFNPVTNIKFAIPQNEFVTMKIFDILGKEAATLVSKDLAAGTYTVDFEASGLASGIYFYTINAGNFSDIKRMMLIK